jgi:serine-type D-Ala-D-Ala carboxypeptidase/endopeptidase (penicillin-binding protein 4)
VESIAKKGYKFIIIVCCLLLPLPTQLLARDNDNSKEIIPDREQVCAADLGKKIEAIIHRPEWLRSQWGIAIETLKSKRILYQLNGDLYFVPASNTKLLSSAAVLLKLGSNFNIKTSFYITGNTPNLSSLRVVGRGDPTLTLSRLKTVAQQLKERGIEKIGELIIDDSYFSNPKINDSWEWGDSYFYYGVSPHSFILEENAFNLTLTPQAVGKTVKLTLSDKIAGRQWRIKNYAITTDKGKPYNISIRANLGNSVLEIRGELPIDNEPDVWGLAIPNPSQYFLASWRQILGKVGIKVDRATIVKTSYQISQNEVEIAQLQSPSLGELLMKMNGDSNNLVAEILLEILAKETQQEKFEILEQTLTELGVDRAGYNIKDGSGLSRQNLIAPKALVEILRLMFDNKIYHQSLSIAGTSGTLKKRFLDTSVRGLVYAKTGTLTGVTALSGYLEIPNYEPIVFSIISNNSTADTPKMRAAIDEIIMGVAEGMPCFYSKSQS